VHTAHEWGLLPSEYWAASAEDRALMTQYVISLGKMRAWDAKVKE
jgi:hypothetical protein